MAYWFTFAQIFPGGDSSQELLLNLSFGTVGCGCTDATAHNYDASAVIDEFLVLLTMSVVLWWCRNC